MATTGFTAAKFRAAIVAALAVTGLPLTPLAITIAALALRTVSARAVVMPALLAVTAFVALTLMATRVLRRTIAVAAFTYGDFITAIAVTALQLATAFRTTTALPLAATVWAALTLAFTRHAITALWFFILGNNGLGHIVDHRAETLGQADCHQLDLGEPLNVL